MPIPSTPNNDLNSNQEQVENDNSIKNDDLSYYKELSKKCARKKISWSDSNWDKVTNLSFCADFNSKKYDKDKFFEDLKNDLQSEDLKKALKLTDQEKDELFNESFSREVNKIIVPYERKKDDLKSIVEKKYTLTDIWRNDIDNAINKLDSDSLDKYLFSPDELEKFIKSIIKSISIDNKKIKEIQKILKTFSFSSPSDFVEKIEAKITENPSLWSKESILTALTVILNKSKMWEPLDSIDVRDLFSYGIFNDSQKKEFLKVFLPVISLKELVELKIIDEAKAEELKKMELIKYLKKKKNVDNIEENDEELIKLVNDIGIKEISVNTDDYMDSNYLKLENSEKFKEELSKTINKTNEEIKEKNLSKISTIEVFKKKIIDSRKIINKFSWWEEDLNKLNNWIIFSFKIAKEDNLSFYEVTNFWDNWTYKWKNRSLDWKYNSSSEINEENHNYVDLFEILSSDKIEEVELITKDELKSKIESWNISEISNHLWDVWKNEIEKYKEKLDREIEEIKKWKTPEELEKDDEYKAKIKLREDLLKDNPLDEITVQEELNLFLLKNKIDEIDPDGKEYDIKEGVSFKINDWDDSEFMVYSISRIDNLWKTIEIQNFLWGIQKITFDQLYKWFLEKKWKITRFTNNNFVSNLVSRVVEESKLTSEWWKFEISDNKIVKKWNDKVTYPYLVQDKTSNWKCSKLLKIYDTVWAPPNQMVKISLGEVKEIDSNKKNEKWDSIKEELYETWNEEYVTVWFLENYIKQNELKPKTLENVNEESDKVKDWVAPKWWFFKWFLSNKSFHEMAKWLKMWFDEFKNHLKWWNEEHAAKVALSTWWRFLPFEVKMELVARVEWAESKHMEDYIKRLETMDSWQAVRLIDKRLSYKNTEEYKKEAWLMFMLKKYWNLYNKDPLNKKKWEFLWFKALTWYRWDVTKHPLYIDIKSACEKESRNFTEEELVWMLTKKQCSEHGYNWIHRRSRLHKEVERDKKAWVNSEFDDWAKKAWETRNPKEQLRKWVSEFLDWSPANWIWRLQWLIDRGSSMQDYNLIPFMLVCSWNWRTYSDTLSNKIKSVIDAKRPVLLARFMSYPADMDLAKETMRVLAHKIHEYNPTLYPNIWKDIEELYKITNSNDIKITEKMKLEECKKFYEKINPATWKTYGDIMTRSMYNLADWRHENWDDVNIVLLLNKDKPWKENKVLRDFYNKFIGYSFSNNYSDDDYMSDSFINVWTSSFWANVSQTLLLQGSEWWHRMKKSWSKYCQEIIWEINAIRKRKYKSLEIQKFHLDYYLKMLFKWLFLAHGTNPDKIIPLFRDPWDLAILDNKWWVNYKKIVDEWLSERKIDEWEWQHIFDEFVYNILNDTKWIDVKKNIFSILENKKNKADDYYMKKAA